MVRGQYGAIRVGSQDRGRTALHEELQSPFGLAPQFLFMLHTLEVLHHKAAVTHQSRHKKSGSRVGQNGKHETRQFFHSRTWKVKDRPQNGAQYSHTDYLRRR